jgi:hypothetical protein
MLNEETDLIDFEGYRLSYKQQALIKETASIALDCLVSKRMINSLEITVEVTKDLYKKTGTLGNCSLEDDAASPKFFTIELNYSGKQSFNVLISTLCHELVHVAQYAQRRLRCLSCSYKVAWMKDHYNTQEVEYDDRPWEIEAHALEKEIYAKVKKNFKIKKYIEENSCSKFEKKVGFA